MGLRCVLSTWSKLEQAMASQSSSPHQLRLFQGSKLHQSGLRNAGVTTDPVPILGQRGGTTMEKKDKEE
jgi:hypothetical protein